MEKLELFNQITPLYKLNYKMGNTNIWIKRDDLIEFAFGGNKVRLMEYIAGMIVAHKVDRVVTYGSSYSNYIRVVAAVCAKIKVECDLILIEENHKKSVYGNSVLIDYYSNHILHCKEADAHSFIDEYQQRLRDDNINYLWIPGGGHTPEAAFGYVDAAREIKGQMNDVQIFFDNIFLPCGTGTTEAGLAWGFADTDIAITGVSVARSVERCKREIANLLHHMEEICENNVLREFHYDVIEGQTKYGECDLEMKQIISELAVKDGIFLDPIYNAKAFLAMKKYVEKRNDLKDVLYVNTGGTPNIFTV